MILREVKSNPYKVLKTFAVNTKHVIGLKGSSISYFKLTDLPIADRYSTGSQISKERLTDSFITAMYEDKKSLVDKIVEDNFTNEILKETEVVEVIKDEPVIESPPPVKEETREKTKEEINLREIDDKLLTIEDFLNSD